MPTRITAQEALPNLLVPSWGLQAVRTDGGDAFVAKIVGLVEEALGRPVDPGNVTSRPSSKGKYVSANVTARLENGDEVIAVFSKLKACEDVKWYL